MTLSDTVIEPHMDTLPSRGGEKLTCGSVKQVVLEILAICKLTLR